jgi:hypothetical protein
MQDFLILYVPPVIGMFILAGFLHARFLEFPKYRGWWGEYKVNLMLRLCLSGEYTVFANAIYRGKESDETTQVDHIVVSRFGVFVLETKSLKGRIYTVADTQQPWLQIVGRRKYSVHNPLQQNYAHIKAIQRVIGLNAQKMHSYVVTAGSAEFPEGLPERVYSIWGVVRKIQSYRTAVMSRGCAVDICRSLSRRRIKGGYWAAQRHVARLQAQKEVRKKADGGTGLSERR